MPEARTTIDDGAADGLLEAPTNAAPWRRALAQRLGQAPDPQRAATLAARTLTALDETGQSDWLDAAEANPESFARVLSACCGTAAFFAPHLIRNPGWLAALAAEDDSQPRRTEELHARVAATCESGFAPILVDAEGVPIGTRLRRAKYYELARITARDAFDDRLPLERSGETLAEISALADALLAAAEAAARREVEAKLGPPLWRDAAGVEHRLGFSVLGLGKLGSSELNYSSDVDLIYLHGATPDGIARKGPSDKSPLEYFTRLAQTFGRLVAETNGEGFLYRVDLDLRPEGAQGVLVVSDAALAHYYEAWADTWEKAAFMKARPVAGDLALGWKAIRAVAPSIYRSSIDYEGVRGIRKLKDGIEREHGRERDGFDVKVGAGGIRDIEFVAQALQLLHGGRIPQLRERSTQRVLEQLATLDLLDTQAELDLRDAYRYLRRLENRLQMEAERQTHRLPKAEAARLRIARAVYAGGAHVSASGDAQLLAAFDAEVAAKRERTREIFQGLLPEGARERVLDLFARNAPGLLGFPTTRKMVEELAAHFAGALEGTSSPERALNNLDRFVDGIGENRFYFELLLDRPELVERLSALFDASNYLSALFASHPGLIEPVFENPNVLLLSREELEADYATLRDELIEVKGEEEGALDALRRFQARQVINVGLLDVSRQVGAPAIERALTDIACVCAERALDVVDAQLAGRRARLARGDALRFLIVGMGKLGTHELSYGSDLDVIFLYDLEDFENASPSERLEAGEHCARIAQRWIGALQTTTGEGRCYEIDARLRPSGNQGVLVTSLAGFADYHGGGGQGAAVWERQALLRARPIAGDPALAQRFEDVRRAVLARPLPDDLREEIDRIRMRMEVELGRETGSRRDFKTGQGGVLDVESIVQYLQLASAAEHPELMLPAPLRDQLVRLEALGLIAPEAAAVLREGWDFVRELSRALRIVENRSISDLDEERGDLEGLALRLGYKSVSREGGARRALLADYQRHTEAVRRIYLQTFGRADG